MHEIAHWCIASEARRMQIDYGYWYFPEDRDATQQALFEDAEVKPQTLEYLFAQAAGSRFVASADNFIDGQGCSTESFENKIAAQVQCYLTQGLPEKAAHFMHQLSQFYQ